MTEQESIKVREVTRDEFLNFFDKHSKEVFAQQAYHPQSHLSESELESWKRLEANRKDILKIFLLAYKGERPVGWAWGYQTSASHFYMCNSAVLPEFQRQGVYSSLLETMLAKVRDAGFQCVHSDHFPTNRAVLIAKLKAGFVIEGMRMDARFGNFVSLVFHFNPLWEKINEWRHGARPMDEEIQKSLGGM